MAGRVHISIAALLALAALTGCEAPPGRQRAVDIRIEHREVAPAMRVVRVGLGDAVRLRWTTDEALSVHLHGYDVERALVPGEVTELAFDAFASGRFAVNVHSPGSAGERLLLYLEVR